MAAFGNVHAAARREEGRDGVLAGGFRLPRAAERASDEAWAASSRRACHMQMTDGVTMARPSPLPGRLRPDRDGRTGDNLHFLLMRSGPRLDDIDTVSRSSRALTRTVRRCRVLEGVVDQVAVALARRSLYRASWGRDIATRATPLASAMAVELHNVETMSGQDRWKHWRRSRTPLRRFAELVKSRSTRRMS